MADSRQPPKDRCAITPEALATLLRYEPETGKLYWLPRDPQHFTKESRCRSWNTRHAGKEAFTVGEQGYRRGMVFRRMYMAHIAAWAITHGRFPVGQIDHINGIRDDNRLENLRDVTRSENARNSKQRVTNTSGAMGVVRQGKRWRAYLNLHLGVFDTMEEAVAARKAKEAELGYHPNHGRSDPTQDERAV